MNDSTIPIDPNKIYPDWVYKYGLRYPYGFCQCGCNNPTPIARWFDRFHGFKPGDHHRYITHHNFRNLPGKNPESIFWSYVSTSDKDQCWGWTGCKRRGYGTFSCNGIAYLAHRFSYEHFCEKLNDGQVVMHTCDNPACTNPHHLRAGTLSDNMHDMVQKNRQAKGETNGHAKLTDQAVREIRNLLSQGVNQYVIANQFHIDQAQISNIHRGKSWKHVK